MTPFVPPPGYSRIRVVQSFAELLATPLAHGVNAICWERTLPGDFVAVVAALGPGSGVAPVDEVRLRGLPMGPAGRRAVDAIVADLQSLRAAGHQPSVDRIDGYPGDRDDELPVDVFSFHVDSATVPTDTFLCTYSGAPSEGLRDDQATPRCAEPRQRARLLARFGGGEGPHFEAWLAENFHDLHFEPAAGAQPFSFGNGNLWRIAVAHPQSRVPACIHRAPRPAGGSPPRLLLIS